MPSFSSFFGRKDKQDKTDKNPNASSSSLKVPPSSRGRASSTLSRSSKASTSKEYILPDLELPASINGSDSSTSPVDAQKPNPLYANPNASGSTSKIRLVNPFRWKNSPSTQSAPSSIRSNSSPSGEGLLPPIRNSVFSTLDTDYSQPSSPVSSAHGHSKLGPSQPRPVPVSSRSLPIPKTPEMRTSTTVKVFNVGKHSSQKSIDQLSRPSSNAEPVATSTDEGTFKLKSFRPVSPGPASFDSALIATSTSNSPNSTTDPNKTVGIGPRRGNSNSTDTSQRITVGAFREAQSRNRSSSHLPEHASDGMPPGNVPLPLSTARPASPAGSTASRGTPPRPNRQLPPSSFGRNSPQVTAPRSTSRLGNHRWANSSSDSDSSEKESDDEDDSEKKALGRGNTITQRSASQEPATSRPSPKPVAVGFGASQSEPVQIVPPKSRSEIGHAFDSSSSFKVGTPPSSFSRGTFTPTDSRTKQRPMLNMAKKGKIPLKDSDASTTSTDEESESSDSDAPLSTLVPPRRPGSAMSTARSASPAGSTRSGPQFAAQDSTSSFRFGSPTTNQANHNRNASGSTLNAFSMQGQQQSRGRQPMVDLDAPSDRASGKPVSASPVGMPTPPLSRGSSSSNGENQTPPPSGLGVPRSTQPLRKPSPLRNVKSNEALNSNPLVRPRSSTLQELSSPNTRTTFTKPSHAHTMSNISAKTASTINNRNMGDHPHSIMRPRPPFARGDSPASSSATGSSGAFPSTPRTCSEAGGSSRKGSVTFIEPFEAVGGSGSGSGSSASAIVKKVGRHKREASDGAVSNASDEKGRDQAESKRRERRRSEAKAAIELGRIVNGPAPVDPDEDQKAPNSFNGGHLPKLSVSTPGWGDFMSQFQGPNPQMQAAAAAMGNPAFNMPNMGMMGNPAMSSMPGFNPAMMMGMGMNPMMGMNMPSMTPMGNGLPGMPNFALPPVPQLAQLPAMAGGPGGLDPSIMVAHQQAMFMAKQAYQLAVAQQAMAAAGDEWERASCAGGFGGGNGGSIYGGSMLNGWGGGAASVYGGMDRRPPMSAAGGMGVAFPGAAGSEWGGPSGPSQPMHGQNGQPRQRTRTAPSSSAPPAHLRGAGAPPLPPPSSWKTK